MSFYWLCALAGTGMFIIQVCLNLMGLGEYEGFDEEGITEAGNFKWLSRQALTGFLMMFGWSALTCQKEFNLESTPTLWIAFLSGMVTIFATGFIFKIAKKFHSSGTIFKIEDTIGLEAMVYQRIPSNGTGKISVSIDSFSREIEAWSSNHIEIPSFVRVKIINKFDDKTVIVEIL